VAAVPEGEEGDGEVGDDPPATVEVAGEVAEAEEDGGHPHEERSMYINKILF